MVHYKQFQIICISFVWVQQFHFFPWRSRWRHPVFHGETHPRPSCQVPEQTRLWTDIEVRRISPLHLHSFLHSYGVCYQSHTGCISMHKVPNLLPPVTQEHFGDMQKVHYTFFSKRVSCRGAPRWMKPWCKCVTVQNNRRLTFLLFLWILN